MLDEMEDQMGRSAEPGQAELLTVLKSGQFQGSIADGPGAEKRRRFGIAECCGDGVGKIFLHRHEFRIPAVGIPSGRPEIRAQVLLPVAAKPALSASRVDPGHAGAIAGPELIGARARLLDNTHDLMAENDRQPRRRRPPLDFIQFGVANPARVDLEQKPTLTRCRFRDFAQLQWILVQAEVANSRHHHRLHDNVLLAFC